MGGVAGDQLDPMFALQTFQPRQHRGPMAPLPPKVMLLFGTSAGLEEVALKLRLPAAVSKSPTVTTISAITLPSFTDLIVP